MKPTQLFVLTALERAQAIAYGKFTPMPMSLGLLKFLKRK